METYFTLKDIQTLLLQKHPKLKWNFEIYESRTGDKMKASVQNFVANMRDRIVLACTYKECEYPLKVSVSDFAFLVFEDEQNIMDSGSTMRVRNNFTNDWTSILLAEHGYDYAKKLLRYCEKCKKQINDNATKEIIEHVQEIKTSAERESLPYEKLIQKIITNYGCTVGDTMSREVLNHQIRDEDHQM